MNAKCYGHRLQIHGTRYYRCLYDGKVISRPEDLPDGSLCPLCQRPIEGEDAAVLSYRETITAKVDLGSIGVVKIKVRRLPTPIQVEAER